MTQLPGPLPPPPDDFASRKLPLIETKGPLFRLHAVRRDALHFGRTASWRFDDPERRYGVCYTATDIHGAFAETFTKALQTGLIAEAELRSRGLARISCRGRSRSLIGGDPRPPRKARRNPLPRPSRPGAHGVCRIRACEECAPGGGTGLFG